MAFDGQPEHLPEWILGLAGKAGGPPVGNADLVEADPGRHAAQEAVALAHLVHHIDHLAVQQAEIAGIQRESSHR